MLKKSYMLVAVLSFMFMGPAFSMEGGDESDSDPISTKETPRGQETSQKKEGDSQSSGDEEKATLDSKKASSGQSAGIEDSKKAPSPSSKSSKKSRVWCCFSSRKEKENDDE